MRRSMADYCAAAYSFIAFLDCFCEPGLRHDAGVVMLGEVDSNYGAIELVVHQLATPIEAFARRREAERADREDLRWLR